MKKLIPALCMLLVAACLMGTSTYAWFSANENVTASGMSVKAASDGGLGIASYTAVDGTPDVNDFVTNAVAAWSNHTGVTNPTIKPTSVDDGTWYTATAANVDEFNGSDYATITAGTEASYYNLTKWQIKSLDQSGKKYDLRVSGITVTNTTPADKTASTALNKALRVAIHVVETDAWFYFAPAYAANAELYYTNGLGNNVQKTNDDGDLLYKDATTGAETTTAEGNTAIMVFVPDRAQYGVGSNNTFFGTNAPANAEIYENLSTTAINIEVYVYYEGEDGNCKTSNAFSIDTLDVVIEYAAAEHS